MNTFNQIFNQPAEQKEVKNRIFNAIGLTFIYLSAAILILLQLRSSL